MSEQSIEEVGTKFYLQELKWFLKLGLPLSATYFFNFLQLQIAVAFAGHRSKEELDAIGLANSYYTLVVVSLSVAIGHAFSGRFGAAYGAKRPDLMRDDLHRSIIAGLCIIFGMDSIHNAQPLKFNNIIKNIVLFMKSCISHDT